MKEDDHLISAEDYYGQLSEYYSSGRLKEETQYLVSSEEYNEHLKKYYSTGLRLKEEGNFLLSAEDYYEHLSEFYSDDSNRRRLKGEGNFLISAEDYYEHLSEFYSDGGSSAASPSGETLCGGHAALNGDPTTLLDVGHGFVVDDPDGSCDNDDGHELLEEVDAYSAFRAAAAAAAGVEKATALAIVLLVIEHGAAPFDDPEVVALCRALDRASRESLVSSLEDYFGDFYDTASLELGSLRYALLHDDDEDVLFEPALLDEDVELWIDVLFFLVVFGAACALSAALRTFYRLASAHPHATDTLSHPAVKATSRRRTKQRKKVVLTSLGAAKSDPPNSLPTAPSTQNDDDARTQEHESDDDDEDDLVPAPAAAAARSVPPQAQPPQRWQKAHRPHHHKEYRSLSKDGALCEDTSPPTTAIAVVSEASAAAAGQQPSPQPQRALTPPRRKKPAPPSSTPQARRPIDLASSKVDRRSFAEAALGTAKPTEPPPSIVAASVKVVPLPPDVCDEDLRARFARYGGVVGARVFGDADPPHGFVDFECRADAVAAAFDAHGRSLFVDSDFGRVACIVRERALSDSDLGLPSVARLRHHV